MRQPTLDRKRRARQQRLLRTGIGVVLAVGVAAILANLFAGPSSEPPASTPQVAFRSRLASFSDAGNIRRAKRVPAARAKAEQEAITDILNRLYQHTFVDPSVFETTAGTQDGVPSFPPADVLEVFSDDARGDVVTDVDSTTLGSGREAFGRVEPTSAEADISIYFRNGREASLATAQVTFAATGTLRDETAFPVSITQNATFHFAREQGRWVIVFYEAAQQQDSILPSPSPTGDAP